MSTSTTPSPETGKIAVKVINDYGDEVLKVYEVAGVPPDHAGPAEAGRYVHSASVSRCLRGP